MDLIELIIMNILIYFYLRIPIKLIAKLIEELTDAKLPVEKLPVAKLPTGREELIKLSTIPRYKDEPRYTDEKSINSINIKDMFGSYFLTINEIKSESASYVKNGSYSSYIFSYSSPEKSCVSRFKPLSGFHRETVICRVENDVMYFDYTPYPQNDTTEFRYYNVIFTKM
jgi:hypothetical protein